MIEFQDVCRKMATRCDPKNFAVSNKTVRVTLFCKIKYKAKIQILLLQNP